MWTLYLISVIPVAVFAVLWVHSRRIVWWEFLLSVAISVAVASAVCLATVKLQTLDHETWSGRVVTARYTPKWIEECRETDNDGRTTTTHKTHYPEWVVYATFGVADISRNISEAKYMDLLRKFGKYYSTIGNRPGFYEGDRNDYWLSNIWGYFEPIQIRKHFKNMFKASQNVMSFIKVPEGVNVFPYPENRNLFVSNRLLGVASCTVDILEWDRLNSRLWPRKEVNLILIGFKKGTEPEMGKYQESAWLGGKKNDVVLCYCLKDKKHVDWSYVFGWTEKAIVKKNLETMLLINVPSNKILPLIENEIRKYYVPKDWDKFNYLTIYPSLNTYIVLIVILAIAQILYGSFVLRNDTDKGGRDERRYLEKLKETEKIQK